MVVQVPALHDFAGGVGKEEPYAFAPRVSLARVHKTLRGFSAQRFANKLRFGVIITVERRCPTRISTAKVMERGLYTQGEFPKLRGPACGFPSLGHESAVVIHRFEECGFKPFCRIENAVGPVGESARTIRADMGKGRH